MVVYFADLQYEVRTPWALLLGLVLIGIFYTINRHIRTNTTYDWMVAFKKGVTVALIASVITGIFLFIYYSAIDTSFLENQAVKEYNELKSQIPKDKIEEYNKSLKARFKPNTYAIVTVSVVNILGLIGSLMVALLGRMTVKRK